MERLWQAPGGPRFFEYLNSLPGPLRSGRQEEFAASIGLAEFRSPVSVTAFITAPILHQGVHSGNIYVGSYEPGREFSREDEETLVLFASQAAQVIANARRHRDEDSTPASAASRGRVEVAMTRRRTASLTGFRAKERVSIRPTRSSGRG